MRREWKCIDTEEEYLVGGMLRLQDVMPQNKARKTVTYEVFQPSALWTSDRDAERLPEDGGRTRPRSIKRKKECHPSKFFKKRSKKSKK